VNRQMSIGIVWVESHYGKIDEEMKNKGTIASHKLQVVQCRTMLKDSSKRKPLTSHFPHHTSNKKQLTSLAISSLPILRLPGQRTAPEVFQIAGHTSHF